MSEPKAQTFFQIKPQGLTLLIHLQPGAKKSQYQGITAEGFLKIQIQAPAVEGKANQALIEFLAQNLGLRKTDIEILSGEFSRKKRLLIKTNQPFQVLEKIKDKF